MNKKDIVKCVQDIRNKLHENITEDEISEIVDLLDKLENGVLDLRLCQCSGEDD